MEEIMAILKNQRDGLDPFHFCCENRQVPSFATYLSNWDRGNSMANA